MGDAYIIAIDFGTAYSGYAFLISGKDPILPQWGIEEGLATSKTPTCVLFDENEEFLKFGYDAKREYTRKGNEKAKKTLLFENFKMGLYGKKLNEDLMITAINGKEMSALKVFTESVRYLKDHALNNIAESTRRSFTASDFTWVLTVPAIWDASAKQFMRKAATQAGIVTESQSDKLVIALESEAASIWCMQLPSDGFTGENTGQDTLQQQPGTQYIVVDCGGGTIDITVHEVCDGGFLKELHKASGNDMGGEQVTKQFKSCLREIFSHDLWNEYERKFPSELQQLMYNFLVLKKGVDDDVKFSCPFNLAELAQKKKPIQAYFKNVQGVHWDEGSIKISKAKMRSFFDESLSGITKCLNEILKMDLSIEYIVLVGGYASSQILREHITKRFGDQCKILCPALAQHAILKGAVMFGRTPAVVTSRKSPFTYGIELTEQFDASKHRAERAYTNDEGVWVNGCFLTLVKIGEDVGWDETRDHTFTPVERDQTSARFGFYRTERTNPQYVDDWGVDQLNSFNIDFPSCLFKDSNRVIQLQVKFGATEITATATDVESQTTRSVNFDFMSK